MMDGRDKDSLYELCKEVYKRKEWSDTKEWHCYEWDVNGYRTGEKSIEHVSMIDMDEGENHKIVPYYDPGYLLEKLLPHTSIRLLKRADGYIDVQYDAERPDYADYSSSDIRITLLKLVIALDEGGVEL